MNFSIKAEKSGSYATCESPDVVIHTAQDALDLMAFAGENDTNLVLLHEQNFHPSFYDLRSGLAGEIAQKLFNYHVRMAIVGSFESVRSERFREFMNESGRGNQLIFTSDHATALAWLARKV